MAHENIKWTETLPAVLLGLRVAVKPDINASSAELVFNPRKAPTLGDKPKKCQARTRWPQVNIAGQGGS
ncbi:hypothetical protein TNCV_725931 [Trichonephila clavipes]|nr:hypothetical protein TNCV_725931 [Trichonephila clavipes]